MNEKKYQEAVAFLMQGKYQESLEILEDLLQSFPDNAVYWSEYGVVYLHLKKKTESLSAMDKAVELEPKKSYRYSSRAYVKGNFDLLEEAVLDYEMAILLDPEDAIAHNNLGLIQEQIGYKKRAKSNFEKADELAKTQIGIGRSDQGVLGHDLNARNIQQEIEEEKKNQSLGKEMLKIFSRDGVTSFLRFIKSGFKKF